MRIAFFVALLCTASIIMAQDKTRNISAEIFGVHNTIGINYDSRFKGNSGLGYRVGIGYSYSSSSFILDETIKGIGIPLEINYLLGRKNHKFELGIGANLGVYHIEEYNYLYTGEDNIIESYINENRFGYFIFTNIGYRYQRPKGFLFRVGLSPSFNFENKHGVDKALLYPYLGFGWSF